MSSNSQHRRTAVAILLSTLGLSGVLVSQGGTQLIAEAVLPLDPSAAHAASLGNVRPAPREDVDATGILHRNIFDHESGPLDRPPVVERPPDPDTQSEETPPEVWDPNGPPPPACDGSMRLVGAFVQTRHPDESFAAITDATGQSLLYQVGMSVDDRELIHIAWNQVVLKPRSGSFCSLTMFGDEEQRVATAPRPTVAVEAPPRAAEGTSPEGLDPAALEAGISQVNDHEFSIDRSLVTNLMTNQAALMRMARVIPHEEGGRVVGVKLYGIRRSSLLGRLGIQNGDMLRTINGYDMTSPDTALEAYARLQSADRITINLQRRGSDMTIDYSIR